MPKCLKCDLKFPNRLLINGNVKNLQNRRFCLSCSPWGKHNTRDISNTDFIDTNSPDKKCPKCEKILPNTSGYFYYKNSKHIGLGTYCKKCSNIYTQQKQKDWKVECINYKGGKCKLCKYDRSMEALEFHHVDPSKKERVLSQSRMANLEKIKSELDKCILVCANCHREIHAGRHSKYLIVKDQTLN